MILYVANVMILYLLPDDDDDEEEDDDEPEEPDELLEEEDPEDDDPPELERGVLEEELLGATDLVFEDGAGVLTVPWFPVSERRAGAGVETLPPP
jgi:hypothetical protein